MASPDIIRFELSIPHDLEEVEWILEEEAGDLRERQEVFVRRGELSIINWCKQMIYKITTSVKNWPVLYSSLYIKKTFISYL